MREELSTNWEDLRQKLDHIASLRAEEKRMEERRDESYWKGVQDLYEAVKTVAADIEDDGMAPKDMEKYFGVRLITDAICKNDPKTIMEKVNEWKADKECAQKEFRVGDEVMFKHACIKEPRKGIIAAIVNADIINLVYRLGGDGALYSYCVVAKDCNKTGRHFDSIPFSYGQEEEV